MIDLTEVIVETSLIASNIIDDIPAAYLAECSEEELHQMVDIPLEGGLLDVEVSNFSVALSVHS